MIWVNYNISPTWIFRPFGGWFRLLTMISSEVIVRSLLNLPRMMIRLGRKSEMTQSIQLFPSDPFLPPLWLVNHLSILDRIYLWKNEDQNPPTSDGNWILSFLIGIFRGISWEYNWDILGSEYCIVPEKKKKTSRFMEKYPIHFQSPLRSSHMLCCKITHFCCFSS